jgi:hypothetical protein
VHVRLERGAHFLDDLRAYQNVRIPEDAADGTESGHVAGEPLLRHGASLDEIALMLARDGPRIDRRMRAANAEELDTTIQQLVKMRDGLRHAAACRAPSHVECPTFQRLLRAAASGALHASGVERSAPLETRRRRNRRG